MSAALQAHHGRSFVDALLVRCAGRPWRMFALLWSVLLLAAVAVGMLGFSYESYPAEPPPIESVPYTKFFGLNSDVGREMWHLYDESRTPPNVMFSGDPFARPRVRRLVAVVTERELEFGWPWNMLQWRTYSYWDVTNPSEPFAPLVHRGFYGSFSWESGVTMFAIPAEAERQDSFILGMPQLLVPLALPLLLAGATVLCSVFIVAWRARRRHKYGRCLACGHRLDPAGATARCQECGGEVTTQAQPRPALLFCLPGSASGWTRLGILLLALFAWVVAQSRTHELRELGFFGRGPAVSETLPPFTDSESIIGWPVRLVTIEKRYSREVVLGGIPMLGSPAPPAGTEFLRGGVLHTTRSDLTGVITTVGFAWPWIVLHASMFILFAALLAGIEWFVRFVFWRKPRAQLS